MGFGFAARFTSAALAIDLPTDVLHIRGVGSMAEPALLTGNIVLNLTQSASIKEITLRLVGKSKLPAQSSNDQPGRLKNNQITTVVYSHDWTFLAGQSRSAHTLNAGRHVFPFQVELDESVPSTLTTHNGSISIQYKLKAHVIRPALAANLHAKRSVRIVRSLAQEALEYQQTHEIENTWPDKIMYSLSIPHKAWAAGDTVCALVKFSPLLKGVVVTSVISTLQETTKIQYKSGSSEQTRPVASIKHEFVNGKARIVETYAVPPSSRTQGGMFHVTLASPSHEIPGSYTYIPPSGIFSGGGNPSNERSAYQDLSDASSAEFSPEAGPSTSRPHSRSRTHSRSHRRVGSNDSLSVGNQDIIALLPVTLPTTATPSHNVDPVDVSYRVRWVASIRNPDGHISELRCSLPIIVLDHSLLTDARQATNETRRLCFGLMEDTTPREEIDLPSYNNHILDRVANSLFPTDAARVHNPWPTRGMDAGLSIEVLNDDSTGIARPPGALPAAPRRPVIASGGTERNSSRQSIDWLDSEFVVSLGETWRSSVYSRRSGASGSVSEYGSRKSSRPSTASSTRSSSSFGPDSTFGSFARSRGSSRTSSRPSTSNGVISISDSSSSFDTAHLHPHYQPPATHSRSQSQPQNNNNNNITKNSNRSSVFGMPLKPLTALKRPSSRKGQPNPVEPVVTVPLTPAPTSSHHAEEEGNSLIASAFNEVPDYGVASRGFLGGGVPPLDLVRGLPSYEDTQRQHPSSRPSSSRQ